MENGFYKCADPSVSTRDWISLNFNEYPTVSFDSFGLTVGSDLVICLNSSVQNPETDEEWEDHRLYPQSFRRLWGSSDHPRLRSSLVSAGFSAYEPHLGRLQDFGALLFGIKGPGSYKAHWIPLRAFLIREMYLDGIIVDTGQWGDTLDLLFTEQGSGNRKEHDEFFTKYGLSE